MGKEGRKIAWVAWEKVCDLKNEGEWVKDIRVFNNVLLEKWICRCQEDSGGLWKEVLDSKYVEWRDLKNNVRNHNESQRWRNIKNISSVEDRVIYLKTNLNGL